MGASPVTCENELLAGGTYVLTVTQLGACFSDFESMVRGILDDMPLELPSYSEIPSDPDVSFAIGGVTVNATIVEQGNSFVLTNINPNPIALVHQGYNVTVDIHSVVICVTSETAVVSDVNATISIQGIPLACTDTARVTGVL